MMSLDIQNIDETIENIKNLHKLKQYDQVIELSKALYVHKTDRDLALNNSQWYDILYYLANSLRLSGKQDSEKYFETIINYFPKRYQGYQGLIDIAKSKKEWTKTVELSKNFILRFPNMWQGYFWIGQSYKNLNKIKEAQNYFIFLTKQFSDLSRGYQELINISRFEKDWKKTIELSKDFIVRFPDMWQGYFWLGKAYEDSGLIEQAMETFRNLNAQFPLEKRGLEGLINIEKKNKNWYAVIDLTHELDSKFNNLWLVNWLLGTSYQKLSKFDKAEESFIELNKLHPNVSKGLEGLVVLYSRMRKYTEAEVYAKELVHRFPEKSEGYYHLGNIYKINKNIEQASSYFKTLDFKFPLDTRGIEGLIAINRDSKELINLLSSKISKFPDNWKWYWLKAQLALSLKDYENAIFELRYLVLHFPHRFESYLALIHLEKIENNGKISISIIENAILSFGKNKLFFKKLSKALNLHGFYSESKEVIDMLIKEYPNSHEGLLEMSKLYSEIKDWNACSLYSQKLVERFPEISQGYLLKIDALVNLDYYNDAEELLDYTSQKFPDLSSVVEIKRKEFFFFKRWNELFSSKKPNSTLNDSNIFKSNQIKIKLFAIAKDEAAYIPEWVYHHLNFGFDEIEIWVNRTTDNSENICNKLVQNNSNFSYRVVDEFFDECESLGFDFQYLSYRINYNKELKEKKFTHIMFLDIDELWTSSDFKTTIKDFLENSIDVDTVSFPWLVDQPNYDKKPFDNYFSEFILGRLSPVVKSALKISNNISEVHIHNAITTLEGIQILSDQSAFTFEECRDMSTLNISRNYNNFARAKQIISNEKVSEIRNKGIDYFVYHLINKSQIEYTSSLLRGERYQVDNSLKTSRNGFIPFEKPIQIMIDQKALETYDGGYQEFIEKNQISEELSEAQQFVLNRFDSVKNIVHNDNKLLALKIFKGLNIFDV